jgi:hypothetical protein
MDAIVIEAKNKKDVKFWLDLAKKIGTRAKSVDMEDIEDTYMALLIDKGMKTENVGREEIMKALGK